MNATLSSFIAHGKYQGVLRILIYNWPFYAVTVLASLLAVASIRLLPLPSPLRALLYLALACAAFWLVASLAVSHYLYDRSRLYRWEWLFEKLPVAPRRWANIHAGLDETSAALRRAFPRTNGTVLDIYEAVEMPEASIARARRLTPAAAPARAADLCALPLDDGACDALFLIFAAHEIRRPAARQRFFAELRRALKPEGVLVLVEHLRDGWNFLAFGPGFLHFLSRRTWMRSAHGAGLQIREEFSITPFVRGFILSSTLAVSCVAAKAKVELRRSL